MKKLNRTTTLESLRAVVGLLLCETKEQFEYYYRLATKDDVGASIWFYINRRKK